MIKLSINPKDYIVFDVETNGLKSKHNDLLSISLYKPDDGKEYSKFLPLEINTRIYTTRINGITKKNLIGATALKQSDFDNIVEEFELEKRTILIYAGKDFDATFLREYMKRHNISGYEKLTFYNFKNNIISSRYSDGNITKDNLCRLFGIGDVDDVHNGLNDCKLEWELFEKMNGYFYFITEGVGADKVFRLNDDYIIPAGYLHSHPRLSNVLKDRPYIECQSTLVKTFEIEADGIEKFPTNITGMTIEHLINSMLEVDEQDSRYFLLENKKKLKYIGKIPNNTTVIPMRFNLDGTISVTNKRDKKIEKRINATAKNLKERICSLVDFIRHDIFQDEKILSHELVIDEKNNMLALCDLSTSKTILEIKANNGDSLMYKEQLFYEAKGREIYHLKMEWVKDEYTGILKKIKFHIVSVDVHIGKPDSQNWYEGKQKQKRAKMIADIKKNLSEANLSLISFVNTNYPVKVQCKICEYEWTVRYASLKKRIPKCPKCNIKMNTKNKTVLSAEERRKLRADNYFDKILQSSNYKIVAINYIGAKEEVDAKCIVCNHKWKIRADCLIDRCWCPICKKGE